MNRSYLHFSQFLAINSYSYKILLLVWPMNTAVTCPFRALLCTSTAVQVLETVGSSKMTGGGAKMVTSFHSTLHHTPPPFIAPHHTTHRHPLSYRTAPRYSTKHSTFHEYKLGYVYTSVIISIITASYSNCAYIPYTLILIFHMYGTEYRACGG